MSSVWLVLSTLGHPWQLIKCAMRSKYIDNITWLRFFLISTTPLKTREKSVCRSLSRPLNFELRVQKTHIRYVLIISFSFKILALNFSKTQHLRKNVFLFSEFNRNFFKSSNIFYYFYNHFLTLTPEPILLSQWGKDSGFIVIASSDPHLQVNT